jgi:addiction module HigA family antidote
MARMFDPPHPGATLREDILPALGITVTEAARQLGVSRVALSRVLHEQAGISVDLALRLELWLGGPNKGPSAETWLAGQVAYDLWQAEHSGKKLDVMPAPAPM